MNDYAITLEMVISKGDFELSTILTRIDTLWIEEKLSDEERNQLTTMAQENATPHIDNIEEEITRLWEAIHNLQNSSTFNEYPDYDPDRLYFNGDKMTYTDGKKYICIIKKGKACKWGPDKKPGDWEEVNSEQAESSQSVIPDDEVVYTASAGMEYEYGKYYRDPQDNQIYICQKEGEPVGGKVKLYYLPHEMEGSYFIKA